MAETHAETASHRTRTTATVADTHMHGTHPVRSRATNRDPSPPGGHRATATVADPSIGTEGYEALRDAVGNETTPGTMARRTDTEFDEAHSDVTATTGRLRGVRSS